MGSNAYCLFRGVEEVACVLKSVAAIVSVSSACSSLLCVKAVHCRYCCSAVRGAPQPTSGALLLAQESVYQVVREKRHTMAVSAVQAVLDACQRVLQPLRRRLAFCRGLLLSLAPKLWTGRTASGE